MCSTSIDDGGGEMSLRWTVVDELKDVTERMKKREKTKEDGEIPGISKNIGYLQVEPSESNKPVLMLYNGCYKVRLTSC